jgi:type VI secretion system secreted protein VgrG
VSTRSWFEPSVTIDGAPLRALRWDLEDRLSEPSAVRLELVRDGDVVPTPAEVLGKKVVFTLREQDGTEMRTFGGLVFEARRRPDADDVVVLEVVARSSLAQLALRRDCRIFQDEPVDAIVEQVLGPAGLAKVTWALGAALSPRVYVAQYRETDLAFITRLLSEEGIWFVLRADDAGSEEIILGDAPDGAGELEGEPFVFRHGFGHDATGRHVMRVERTEAVASDRTFSRDYDPDKPALQLEADAEGSDEGAHDLEVYEWPARAQDEEAARRRATVLAEELQGRRDVLAGEVTSVVLVPGLRTTLEGHPWDGANGAITVFATRVEGEVPRTFEQERAGVGGGRVARFSATFRAVPTEKVKLRPERVRREARVVGAQTAFTTGAGGEEIHVDAAGRVKVSFHWDRSGREDDTSSLWIRTSQAPLGGSMLLPRVGWETNLRFLEGDVDRPLVMGRLTNAETPPPYSLPGAAARSALQTATSPGGGSSNEIRMSDEAGAEEMFVNASKDMTVEVKNNATEVVGNDKKKKVGANQSRNVTDSSNEAIGANQTLSVGGDQKVSVETFMVEDVGGDHTLDIGGNRDKKIGGDHKCDVTGSSSLDVGANMIDLVVGAVAEKAVGDLSHTVGGALIELCVGNRTTTVGGSRSETAGAVKVIATNAGRGVEVGGSLTQKVAGAVVNLTDADRAEKAGSTFTEVAAGAQVVKATNVTLEGDSMIAIVMGASALLVTPAAVVVVGLSAKLDGDVVDKGIVIDN